MSHRAVIVMCGLPVSGKTTAAGRLHAAAGGALIRSCDVFQALGISLPAWVRRTRRFTVDVARYTERRDAAYREMAARLARSLAAGAGPVVLDAVHGERAKRQVVYEICRARSAGPLLVWCRCDDPAEIARRFAARRGRETEPEHEAGDRSVFRHLAGLWEDPREDRLPDGAPVPIVTWDSVAGALSVVAGPAGPVVDVVRAALEGRPPVAAGGGA